MTLIKPYPEFQTIHTVIMMYKILFIAALMFGSGLAALSQDEGPAHDRLEIYSPSFDEISLHSNSGDAVPGAIFMIPCKRVRSVYRTAHPVEPKGTPPAVDRMPVLKDTGSTAMMPVYVPDPQKTYSLLIRK